MLRWRQITQGAECVAPFTVNFWANSERGRTLVSAEYTTQPGAAPVQQVVAGIHCPSGQPTPTAIDGELTFDPSTRTALWRIPDGSSSASLEFSLPEVDNESFFPIQFGFASSRPFSKIAIVDVVAPGDADTGVAAASVPFDEHVHVALDKVLVE